MVVAWVMGEARGEAGGEERASIDGVLMSNSYFPIDGLLQLLSAAAARRLSAAAAMVLRRGR